MINVRQTNTYMKVKRTKVPYRKEPLPYRSEPSVDDLKRMEQYAKEDKLQELKDLVNERVAGKEEDPDFYPGLSTRDFLSSALTKSIKNRYPELSDLPEEEQVRFLQEKVYPGLDRLEKGAGRTHRVKFDRPSNAYDPNTGQIDLDRDTPNLLATALHEMGHSVDENILELNKLKNRKKLPAISKKQELEKMLAEQDYARRSEAMEEFTKLNPKIKKLLETKTTKTTGSEARPLNPFKREYKNIKRMPNLEDYNYETGEFESDILEDPIEKYKEVGGEHHLERPFSLDNFINFSKGDLKDIVKTDDRFRNLRKKLV